MLPNTKPQHKNSKFKQNYSKSSFSLNSMNNVQKWEKERIKENSINCSREREKWKYLPLGTHENDLWALDLRISTYSSSFFFSPFFLTSFLLFSFLSLTFSSLPCLNYGCVRLGRPRSTLGLVSSSRSYYFVLIKS